MMNVSVHKSLLLVCIYFNVPYLSSHADGEFSLIKVWGSPAIYNVESTVLISDGLSNEYDAGYKVQSVLTVEPIWNDTQPELILLLHVSEYRTWVRRAGSAEWRGGAGDGEGGLHTVAGRWGADGRLLAAYAPPDMERQMLNYGRALISLFQFQVGGERNESDVSGECRAHYLTTHTTSTSHAHAHPLQVTKLKSACSWSGGADGAEGALRSSRVTRYTLTERADGLRDVLAQEEHAGAAGLRAMVTLRATLVSSSGPATASAPATVPARLQPLPEPALALTPPPQEGEAEVGERESVSRAVAGARAALAAMEEEAQVGEEEARAGAAAVARVTRAMGGATATDVQRAMEDPHNMHIRAALSMCAGASGSAAALAGVMAALRGDAAVDRDLLRRCLASVGTARALDDRGLAALLRLADGGAVGGAALLAAAAGTRSPTVSEGAAAAARDRIVRRLARCGTDLSCRALHVRALGNAAHVAHADLLLGEAEVGAGVEAVAALGSLPAAALGADRARRLLRLALRPGDVDTRAAALALAMRAMAEGAAGTATGALGAAALALHTAGPPELRALYWRLLRELSIQHETVRADMRHIQRSHPDLDGWHARAMRDAALSSALRREASAVGGAGGAAVAGGVSLWSVQVAGGGALRRGEVALHAGTVPVLAVDVRARGLHALTGGDGEAEAAEEAGEVGRGEEASAALYVSVGGARLEGVPLFAGSAELAAHVWAGTASAPLRAATHARVWAAPAPATPTAAGVHVHGRHTAAVLLALSARATVSLWSRVADADLHLQSGAVWEGAMWAEVAGVRAEAREEAAPALAVAVTADGYGGARVCVRATRPAYTLHRSAPTAPAAPTTRTRAPPHTLALGARNDRLCRDMHVPD